MERKAHERIYLAPVAALQSNLRSNGYNGLRRRQKFNEVKSDAVMPGESTRMNSEQTSRYAATGACTPLATIARNLVGSTPQLVI
jgi:hypothetical protein